MPEKKETNYVGINYAGSLAPETNMDTKTGIRYGVISTHEVSDMWNEQSEAHYGDPNCPKCGSPCINESEEDGCQMFVCDDCAEAIDPEHILPEEPLSYYYQDEDYLVVQDDYNDLFVVKSPFYTYAQFCSPCAPGACHLEAPLTREAITNSNNRCYALPHSWFNDNLAPYDVFSVKTKELILPDKEDDDENMA